MLEILGVPVRGILWLLVLAPVAFGQPTADTVPDLSGTWQHADDSDGLIAGEPPMTARGREHFALSKPIAGPRTVSATESNAAELTCLPMGFPATYLRPRPFQILQLPNRIVMLFEVSHFWRVVYVDGRDFPEVPLHSWNGYSIGRYEGDTLVVESRHFIGSDPDGAQRWVDRLGHPFSDELTVVERIRRVDDDTLENHITIDDSVAYERPWHGVMTFARSELDLSEFICEELMLSELPEMRPGRE